MPCAKKPKDRTNCQATLRVLFVSAAIAQLLVVRSHGLAQEIDAKASSANGVQPTTVIINGVAKRVISFTPPTLNRSGPPLASTPFSSSDHHDSSNPAATTVGIQEKQFDLDVLVENSVVSIPPPGVSRVVELSAPIKATNAAPQLHSLELSSATASSDVVAELTRVTSLNPPPPTLPIEPWSPPSALVARAHDVLAPYLPTSDARSDVADVRDNWPTGSDRPLTEPSQNSKSTAAQTAPMQSDSSHRIVSVPPPPANSDIPSLLNPSQRRGNPRQPMVVPSY